MADDLLAEFIVATPTEALAFNGGREIEPALVARHKNFTELELGTLYDALKNTDLCVTDLDCFEIVRNENEGEVMTMRLPDAMVKLLAALDEETLIEVGDRWSDSDELGERDTIDLYRVIGDLVRLSRRAGRESKGLYLWNAS